MCFKVTLLNNYNYINVIFWCDLELFILYVFSFLVLYFPTLCSYAVSVNVVMAVVSEYYT